MHYNWQEINEEKSNDSSVESEDNTDIDAEDRNQWTYDKQGDSEGVKKNFLKMIFVDQVNELPSGHEVQNRKDWNILEKNA